MDNKETQHATLSVEHARELQNEIQELFAQLQDMNSQIRSDLNEFEEIKESSSIANSTTNST
ncbi:hypothetical protein SKDZ_12G1910 [Saccharomyces kudriavzevii ZP591]|uniref:Uncharacterized protein n=1 Tax=Saccharomyces kudriavzevii (strain ATCC MYA-4449 / AS 2.2408 / CBS 8840 / NBRC 1802 / NCYC 2889) TaxID=226230 RepID=A0AA35NIM4_SACK1|nr:uncharacterized protein SKDI_12G1910 [Saccharomyces kudriavzevii IFO 1802]CAI4046195.1 hypothetical protein SKDI_12G1910 [Saccharomyces kudriavzevii IFO 1802]CAI4046230.1 hypothetical protein SKDZ_12G1910 [Saccharomyces kudriavzevii ZP591]